MLGKKQVEQIDDQPEKPLLLSIISEVGISLFNHFFLTDWEEQDLFSSFITSVNLFGHEMFSNTLDRVKIGDNTILLKSFDEFLICYAIKGQSYSAQQKLEQFSIDIKSSNIVHEALKLSIKTGKVLNYSNMPILKDFVYKSFGNS